MKKRGYPNKEFRALVNYANEARKNKRIKFYEHKKPKEIDWNAYTSSQIKDAKETLLFIKREVDKCLMPPKKVGKPLTNPKVLAKAVLICEALGFVERKAEGWLEIIGPSVGIKRKLDDRVIGNAYNKVEVAFILKQIFDRNKKSNGKLMGDGTGLETSRRQNYCDNKTSTKEFLTSVIDSREIVQSFDFSGKDERLVMDDLVQEIEGETLCLDAAFNDKELVRKIVERDIIPYIYPKKINRINGGNGWTEMYMDFFTDVIAWLTEYYQRVHCESFHSAFKRVYGIVKKIRYHSKFVQIIARIILHNRARLSYFRKIR
jgi:transposase